MAKIETTFIRPKELYTPETGETKVIYNGYQNNPHELITEDGFAGALDTAMPTALAKAQVIETTWQELKDKRDNGQLIAGSLYRITDYNCTTTQENTQSAGHQFDIVLLALSADKLAEEGWAMMHDNIYDVTFSDGVTKKCYIYHTYQDVFPIINIVNIETKLGLHCSYIEGDSGNLVTIDENAKTASTEEYDSIDLTVENLTYNYFQNSNLSAWKVWYCLDNDTARFAWADDSIDETVLPCITTTGNNKNFYRNKSGDVLGASLPYAWTSLENETKYTKLEEPESGRIAISNSPNGLPANVNITFTPGHEGTGLPNGRGVIYRLIDEWNNDCPYDFKNVLYLRKVTDGEIDAQGTDTYIPTFCLYDIGNDEYKDASIFAIEYPDDEGKARPCNNIFIGSILAIDRSMDSGIYALPQNIILAKVDTGWSSRDITLVNVFMCNFTNSTSHVIYLSSSNKTYVGDNNTIISQGKRVVWENIS